MDKRLIASAILGFIVGIAVGYAVWGLPTIAVASIRSNKPEKIYWCHVPREGKAVQLHLPWQALEKAGHVNAQGQPLHRGDFKGMCPTPKPTDTPRPTRPPKPTPTPTESPTPTVLVCLDNGVDEPRELTIPRTQEAWDRVLYSWPESYVGECEVVEPTPTPTPTLPPESGGGGEPENVLRNDTTGTPEICVGVATPQDPANFHLYRLGGQADLRWMPTDGDTVNIYWKNPSAGDWEHSLINSDNDGIEMIEGLGSYDWTFGLAQVNDNCNQSNVVEVVDGATSSWMLFR